MGRALTMVPVRENYIHHYYQERQEGWGEVSLEQGHFRDDARLPYRSVPCMVPVIEGTSTSAMLGSLKQFMSANS